MKILILGAGAREHAIADALAKSRLYEEGGLHCAPGNAGITSLATIHDADPCCAEAVSSLCKKLAIELVVIGPEAPLVAGVADRLRERGILVFGPSTDGARLEGSKTFAKLFMSKYGIPTAPFDICRSESECRAALAKRRPPYVIKEDGLAAGKGVYLPEDEERALSVCRGLLSDEALPGSKIVIEDYLPGLELTVLALTDGTNILPLTPSRDHKRAYDGDNGPNTGGMGAYSPVTLPEGTLARIKERILLPTLAGLKAEGVDYRGVIYAGLMLDRDDETITVVEYNVRFGDPETQVVLPLLAEGGADFGELALACASGDITKATPPAETCQRCAVGVVLASGGYPGPYKTGLPITGLDENTPETAIYHAGTKMQAGLPVTTGGRVLTVVGLGDSFAAARDRAYARASQISFEGVHYRKDIGKSEDEQ